jgi:hypothetical protein
MFDLFFNKPYNAAMDALRDATFAARSAIASSMYGVPFATIAFMSVVAGSSLAMIVGNYDTETNDEEDREEDDRAESNMYGGCGGCGGAEQDGGAAAAEPARRSRGRHTRRRTN